MNLCKRACLYSIRKKGKALTLLIFLLVMATLMLTCLSIQSATETANANIKKALLGYFTINAKTLENGIPEDTVSQILDVDGLSGRYTLRSYTYATYFDADGNLLEINTEGAAQVPEGYENAGRVVANSNSQEDSYFTDGGFEMVEGNPITTETGSQVLIHEKFAQRNGLSVGDTMLLGNVEDKDKTIPVTVAGIFTNTEEQDSIGMAPSYDLSDHRKNHVAFIFQAYNLIDYLTPAENVSLTSKLPPLPILERLGLTKEESKRNVLKLSGGQQQRVAIARALASEAPVILADEPTGNLDEDTAQDITEILKESAHKMNKCVVVVTHSNELAKQADVVFRLKKGNLFVE